MTKFEIEHPYLRFFLLGETAGNNEIKLPGANGWVYQGNVTLGRVFLTYLCYKVFNIHRLPNHHEKYYKCDSSAVSELFNSVKLDVINECVIELRKVYNHTNLELKNAKLKNVKNGKIFLERGLRGDLARA